MRLHANNSLPGAVLLAHGSSEPEAASELKELCRHLSEARPDRRFTPAFLNQEPKLEQAVEALLAQGCNPIRVLPLLVFKGKHLLEDVPRQIAVLRSRHPGLSLELEPHLSILPGFGEILLAALEKT